MPPTVAQTAPAFADAAAEAPPVFGLRANAARRAEYEDRRVLLPPLPPVAQDFVEELFVCRRVDKRALFQQLDDEWTRRVLLPVAPIALEDWTWSKNYSPVYVKPVEHERVEFARPILPPTGWQDESFALWPRRPGSLAAIVLLDEFVNAPVGGGTFGSAPGGRSARFGFSIASFR
jgi:hypothetical protein